MDDDYELFISVAREDLAHARAWKEALAKLGVRSIVYDLDVEPGKPWPDVIREVQRRARATGVVVTQTAACSPYV